LSGKLKIIFETHYVTTRMNVDDQVTLSNYFLVIDELSCKNINAKSKRTWWHRRSGIAYTSSTLTLDKKPYFVVVSSGFKQILGYSILYSATQRVLFSKKNILLAQL